MRRLKSIERSERIFVPGVVFQSFTNRNLNIRHNGKCVHTGGIWSITKKSGTCSKAGLMEQGKQEGQEAADPYLTSATWSGI